MTQLARSRAEFRPAVSTVLDRLSAPVRARLARISHRVEFEAGATLIGSWSPTGCGSATFAPRVLDLSIRQEATA